MLVKFQVKDLVLMAVVSGLTPSKPGHERDPSCLSGLDPTEAAPTPPFPHTSFLHFVPQTVFALPGAKLSIPNPPCCGVAPADQRANRAGSWLVKNNQDKQGLKIVRHWGRRAYLGGAKGQEQRVKEGIGQDGEEYWVQGVEGKRRVEQSTLMPEATWS